MTATKQLIGFVDHVDEQKIMGWVSDKSGRSLKVTIFVDDKRVASVKADLFRPDVKKSGHHPTGNCGFEFDLRKASISLPPQAMVRVVAGKERADLMGSPWPYYADSYLADIRQETAKLNYVNQNKVLIVGLPKSGTSILTYRIASVLPEAEVHFEPFQALGLNHIAFHREATQAAPDVITKSLYYDNTPNQLDLIGAYYNKKIFIIRDPRDLLISTFFYVWNKIENPPLAQFEQALGLVQQKEQQPDAIPFSQLYRLRANVQAHRLSAMAAFAELVKQHQEDWFVLKYEDFIDEKLAALTEHLGFSINVDASVPTGLSRVERSKRYGSWRTWFTEDDVAYYKPLLDDTLNALGYDADDWGLTAVSTLPEKEGSAYMQRIYDYPRPDPEPTAWQKIKALFR